MVYDLSMSLLARSDAQADGLWSSLTPNGSLDSSFVQTVGDAGVYERIFSSDAPVEGRFDFFDGRFLGARMRDHDDIVGIVTLIERAPFGEDDGKLLVAVCQALILEIVYQESRAQAGTPLSNVIVAAIEGTAPEDQLIDRARAFGISVPSRSRVLVVELTSEQPSLIFAFSEQSIRDSLHGALTVMYHGRVVVVVDADRYSVPPLRELRPVFPLPVRIGIGRPNEGFHGMSASYRQARAAMSLAKERGLAEGAFDYDDYCVDDFFATAAGLFDLTPYCDPVVEAIASYDESHATELLKTLEIYLQCAGNALAAARMLSIHKNTMYARLHLVEERFGIDLSSGEACFGVFCTLRMRRENRKHKR